MPITEKPPQCGARTPTGPCPLPPAPGSKRRCRLHTGGAPGGKKNGQYKHGRFSKTIREARIAEINQRARAWAEKAPNTDYGKICVELTLLASKRRPPED